MPFYCSNGQKFPKKIRVSAKRLQRYIKNLNGASFCTPFFKMRILQLGKFYPVRGGVEKVMYDLLTGLAVRGIQCDMLCAYGEKGTAQIAVAPDCKIFCTKTLAKKYATMISPQMVSTLRRIASNYDIIHVHHPDPMAAIALRLSGYKGKVVLHWHSDIVKQKKLLSFYQPLQQWLIHRADLIVGTTPVYIAASSYLKDVQHKCTYLPIGINAVKPDESQVAAIRFRYPGRKIVFSLGRLVHYKGYKYLVEAAKYLDDSFMVLIGGTGVLRDELQQQIEREGVADRVRLLGYVADSELPAYYGACDIYCLSSFMKTEAFAIVQIEAMSWSSSVCPAAERAQWERLWPMPSAPSLLTRACTGSCLQVPVSVSSSCSARNWPSTAVWSCIVK